MELRLGEQGSDCQRCELRPWSLAPADVYDDSFPSEHCLAFFGDFLPLARKLTQEPFCFCLTSSCSGVKGFPGRCCPFLKISKPLFAWKVYRYFRSLGCTVCMGTCSHLVSCSALRSWRHNPVGHEPSPAASGNQGFDSFSRLSPLFALSPSSFPSIHV